MAWQLWSTNYYYPLNLSVIQLKLWYRKFCEYIEIRDRTTSKICWRKLTQQKLGHYMEMAWLPLPKIHWNEWKPWFAQVRFLTSNFDDYHSISKHLLLYQQWLAIFRGQLIFGNADQIIVPLLTFCYDWKQNFIDKNKWNNWNCCYTFTKGMCGCHLFPWKDSALNYFKYIMSFYKMLQTSL